METPKSYLAIYGNVLIPKAYCHSCGSYSFVIKGRLSCCDSLVQINPKKYKRESQPEQKRKRLPIKFRKLQLEAQNYSCFYCERRFDSVVYRGGKTIRLKINWDHQIPYVLTQNNSPTNFVAACHICNHSKYSKVYQTVDEAKLDLYQRWQAKGYSDTPPIGD